MGLCGCAVCDLVFLESFYKHLSHSCQGPAPCWERHNHDVASAHGGPGLVGKTDIIPTITNELLIMFV